MDDLSLVQVITFVIVVVNFLGALIVIPWLSRITKLENKVDRLTESLQTQYMSKSDFESHLNRIESALTEIKGYVMNNRPQ